MKDMISAIIMDFVKLRMNKNESFIANLTLVKRIKNIRKISKSLKEKIYNIFNIESYDMKSLSKYDYDFFHSVFELINSVVIEEDFHIKYDTLPKVYIENSYNKQINIVYSDFCMYKIEFTINKFVKITSNIFGVESVIQFFNNPSEISMDGEMLLINTIRGLYDFFEEYVEQTTPSVLEIIKQYRNEKA